MIEFVKIKNVYVLVTIYYSQMLDFDAKLLCHLSRILQ